MAEERDLPAAPSWAAEPTNETPQSTQLEPDSVEDSASAAQVTEVEDSQPVRTARPETFTQKLILVTVPVVLTAVLAAVGYSQASGSDAARTSTPPTSAPTTTLAHLEDPGDVAVAGVSEQNLPDPCRAPIDGEVSWVQVESYSDEPASWIALDVAGDAFEFCDASEAVSGGLHRLALAQQWSAEDLRRLNAAVPPAQLHEVCELRKQLRIAGGQRAFGAPHQSTYFSDFVTVPTGRSIGPLRCAPLLRTDEQYGSRATAERYIGIVSTYVEGDLRRERLQPLLDETLTPQFIERAGGYDAIVDQWNECLKVRIDWVNTPIQQDGRDLLQLATTCELAEGLERRRTLVFAVAPGVGSENQWRVHWLPEEWGTAPPHA
ncbi:MAG: hypothetical protein GX868_09840 [Actinobacteria bacterium]|nr:hypothetical protein [Actinomycetota bacterium]